MNGPGQHIEPASDFRIKATLGVAVMGVLILTPFSINNFVQGRHLLGAGSLAVVAILAYNAWSIHRGHYRPVFTLLGLVPAMLFFLDYSLRTQGIIGVLWCYPAVFSFYFMLPERMAWIANVGLLVVALPQAWIVLEGPLASRVAATLITVSVFSAIFIRVITKQQLKLEAQAMTDSLTGLFNRTLLGNTLERAIQQNHRTGAPMTLVTLDLDHFKMINDTLGHEAGDTALRKTGELLHQRVRRSDKAFRLGGEEFLVLLYDTGAEDGRRLAETLRSSIESLGALPGTTITASVGVAELKSGDDWKRWMKRSDQNLWRSSVG